MDIWADRIFPLITEKRTQKVTDLMMEEAMHLPLHAINKWCYGKNKSYRSYIPQFAKYFGVSVEYLLGETDDPAPASGGVANMNGLSDVQKSLIESVAKMTDAEAAAMYALAKTLEAGRRGSGET